MTGGVHDAAGQPVEAGAWQTKAGCRWAAKAVPAGGRGIDQDGNGTIDSTEGVNAVAPRAVISSRDGLRETVST